MSGSREVLHPLIERSSCILVPGAYFGDEGKGKTVDAIARHPAVKVCVAPPHGCFGPGIP